MLIFNLKNSAYFFDLVSNFNLFVSINLFVNLPISSVLQRYFPVEPCSSLNLFLLDLLNSF